jgi:hypothetical protein
MNSMKKVYGSVFAYQGIMAGGDDELQETLRCGGLYPTRS